MALRKKRPALKSDCAKKFLTEFLERTEAPILASEVRKAADKRKITKSMLNAISQDLVDKKKGEDGVYYWSLRTSPAYVSDTPAAVRKNAVAFRAGYEEAVEEILWRVKSMCSAVSDKKSKELCLRLHAVLEGLKK